MRSVAPLLLPLLVLPFLDACSNDSPAPADVQGTYTLAVINGPSSCPLQNWNEGATTTGIPLDISQDTSSLSADVGGAGAIFLDLYCGSAHFEGTVSGSDLDLTLTGTRPLSSGSCEFTVDAHVLGMVQNDGLTGIISYVPNTNASPDCAAVRACSAWRSFNGTRPASIH